MPHVFEARVETVGCFGVIISLSVLPGSRLFYCLTTELESPSHQTVVNGKYYSTYRHGEIKLIPDERIYSIDNLEPEGSYFLYLVSDFEGDHHSVPPIPIKTIALDTEKGKIPAGIVARRKPISGCLTTKPFRIDILPPDYTGWGEWTHKGKNPVTYDCWHSPLNRREKQSTHLLSQETDLSIKLVGENGLEFKDRSGAGWWIGEEDGEMYMYHRGTRKLPFIGVERRDSRPITFGTSDKSAAYFLFNGTIRELGNRLYRLAILAESVDVLLICLIHSSQRRRWVNFDLAEELIKSVIRPESSVISLTTSSNNLIQVTCLNGRLKNPGLQDIVTGRTVCHVEIPPPYRKHTFHLGVDKLEDNTLMLITNHQRFIPINSMIDVTRKYLQTECRDKLNQYTTTLLTSIKQSETFRKLGNFVQNLAEGIN